MHREKYATPGYVSAEIQIVKTVTCVLMQYAQQVFGNGLKTTKMKLQKNGHIPTKFVTYHSAFCFKPVQTMVAYKEMVPYREPATMEQYV